MSYRVIPFCSAQVSYLYNRDIKDLLCYCAGYVSLTVAILNIKKGVVG